MRMRQPPCSRAPILLKCYCTHGQLVQVDRRRWTTPIGREHRDVTNVCGRRARLVDTRHFVDDTFVLILNVSCLRYLVFVVTNNGTLFVHEIGRFYVVVQTWVALQNQQLPPIKFSVLNSNAEYNLVSLCFTPLWLPSTKMKT